MDGGTANLINTAGVDVWLAIGGLIAGAVGIVLSILAIAQSVYFYTRSKNTETLTLTALEGIQAQTRTLSDLSAQQLKGLTQIVRDQIRQPDRSADILFVAFEKLLSANAYGLIQSAPAIESSGITLEDHGIPGLLAVDRTLLRNEMSNAYFAIYFYSAQTNVMAQSRLPREEDYDEGNETHRTTRALLDTSCHDFYLMANALDQWSKTEPEFIENHRLRMVFGAEGQRLRSLVATSRQVFEAKVGVAPA